MAYFLAGVADAEIFKGDQPFATAKTLIDSSITIGVSAEDIRAGKGAKLYGKYFHTSTFDLKLSDAMFKLEYIAANVGAEIQLGGDVFTMEEIELTAGSHDISELSRTPVPMAANNPIYLYVKKANENTDVFETITVTEGKFNIISLDKIKSRNGWQDVVEYKGSIEDATTFQVEEFGICKKIDDVTCQVTKKLKIRLIK